MKKILRFVFYALALGAIFLIFQGINGYFHENAVLKQIIARLEADSRVAEVLVTGVNYDEQTNKNFTTVKFLEYDVQGRPMEARYFTFSGNIIQFQSMVIRFDNYLVRAKDNLRGKSVYLFWKIFLLDGKNTQEFELTKVDEIPGGYKMPGVNDPFEAKLWKNFWRYALDPHRAKKAGVKNAQIEAPGTIFVPGMIYTIRIEHDGGLRIDAMPIPNILKGEKIMP